MGIVILAGVIIVTCIFIASLCRVAGKADKWHEKQLEDENKKGE